VLSLENYLSHEMSCKVLQNESYGWRNVRIVVEVNRKVVEGKIVETEKELLKSFNRISKKIIFLMFRLKQLNH
jgi:hypothetical protein